MDLIEMDRANYTVANVCSTLKPKLEVTEVLAQLNILETELLFKTYL